MSSKPKHSQFIFDQFCNKKFQRENKISLRNLSIVLRQKSSTSQEEKLRNIETGLTRAREVISLVSAFSCRGIGLFLCFIKLT